MKKLDPSFRKSLETAFGCALGYLEDLNDKPVAAEVDLFRLRQRLNRVLTDEGVSPVQVIRELVDDVEGGIVGSAGGRFFAWVVGGSLPAALAADWLTSTWDQNAALYASGPAAAVVEEVAGGWLKELMGLPASASFALVNGCQMAHVTCLAAARHGLLAERGWDVEQQGMYGAPPIRILSSDQRHGSFERALRLLGFGLSQARYLPVDPQGRLQADALDKALAEAPSLPTIVLLQAGDVNIGAFDSFKTLRTWGTHAHNFADYGVHSAARQYWASAFAASVVGFPV
jgi:glutamate/tyrosine decarboxylase-like PLP-dependent enzyme